MPNNADRLTPTRENTNTSFGVDSPNAGGGEQAAAQIAASVPACNAMHQFIANNNARE